MAVHCFKTLYLSALCYTVFMERNKLLIHRRCFDLLGYGGESKPPKHNQEEAEGNESGDGTRIEGEETAREGAEREQEGREIRKNGVHEKEGGL